MSLANKRNDHSESHNHNLSSGYHTEKHNPLTCASSPKETTVRLRSYDIETPEAPSGTLQMEAWAWHLIDQSLDSPMDIKPTQEVFRCDARETFSIDVIPR